MSRDPLSRHPRFRRIRHALARLWAKAVVAWLMEESRAELCPHDGTGNGCYGCVMMFGYGMVPPQAALDEPAGEDASTIHPR